MFIRRKELVSGSVYLFSYKPAVANGDQKLKSSDVNERTNRLANALIDLGFRSKDRVVTLMGNCFQYLEVEFALVKGSFLQITLNLRLMTAEQLFQFSETEVSALILQNRYSDHIRLII